MLSEERRPVAIWTVRDEAEFATVLSDLTSASCACAVVGEIMGEAMRTLADGPLPVVLVDNPGEGFNLDSISIDHVTGARAAVTHLLELGHRQIAYIDDNLKSHATRGRLEGYRQALSAWGVPFLDKLVESTPTGIAGGEAAAARLFQGAEPTAIFAFVDPTALGVISYARKCDMNVPNDLAVVGFGGYRLEVPGFPTLSSMAVDAAAMGRLAGEWVLKRLKGKAMPVCRVLVQTTLVRGESSSCDLGGALCVISALSIPKLDKCVYNHRLLAKGGVIGLIAARGETSFPWGLLHIRESSIEVSCHFSRDDLQALVHLIGTGVIRMQPLIKTESSIDNALGVYETLRDRPGELLGIVFDWRE